MTDEQSGCPLKVGDRVRPRAGEFCGLGGIVTRIKYFWDGPHAVISLEGCDEGYFAKRFEIDAPAETSQHPTDLKPRGVKAPLHLIPWAAVPIDLVPYALAVAAESWGFWPDGDALRVGADTGLPGEIFSALLKDEGVTLEDVARVFAHGAKKYARDNWRTLTWDQSARDEYFGAICRHLLAEEETDPESGLLHLAHAACGCLIWAWHEGRA